MSLQGNIISWLQNICLDICHILCTRGRDQPLLSDTVYFFVVCFHILNIYYGKLLNAFGLQDICFTYVCLSCPRPVIERSRFCPNLFPGSPRWTTCWKTAQMAVPSLPCCTFTAPLSSTWRVRTPAKTLPMWVCVGEIDETERKLAEIRYDGEWNETGNERK